MKIEKDFNLKKFLKEGKLIKEETEEVKEEYDSEEDEFEDPNAASGPGINDDGWDEDYFEGIGLMDVLADAAKLSYEIKNARRGSYALDGDSLEDVQAYVEELIDRLNGVQNELENPDSF